jgi:hypothetical protein
MSACMHACVCMYLYVCVYVLWSFVPVHIHTSQCMYPYTATFTYIRVHIHIPENQCMFSECQVNVAQEAVVLLVR